MPGSSTTPIKYVARASSNANHVQSTTDYHDNERRRATIRAAEGFCPMAAKTDTSKELWVDE